MIELVLLRDIFQLVNQYLNGVTYVFSAIFFAVAIVQITKGQMRFSPIELFTLLFFLLSMFISALNGTSFSTIISSFNKVFLCLLIIRLIGEESIIDKKQNTKSIKVSMITTYALCAYVVIMLFLPSSYTDFWGTSTFVMAFSAHHEAASFLVLLIALIDYDIVVGNERHRLVKLAVAAIILYALLQTGARTITACGAILFFCVLWHESEQFDRRLRWILIIIGCFLVVWIVLPWISGTAFFEKSEYTTETGSFSSGRDSIWSYYISEFMSFNFLQKIFGAGFGFLAEQSDLSVGAHNDVLTFLVATGIVGLLLYISYMLQAIVHGRSGLWGIVAAGLFIFCAITNGFYGYTELVCSLVVFLFAERKRDTLFNKNNPGLPNE